MLLLRIAIRMSSMKVRRDLTVDTQTRVKTTIITTTKMTSILATTTTCHGDIYRGYIAWSHRVMNTFAQCVGYHTSINKKIAKRPLDYIVSLLLFQIKCVLVNHCHCLVSSPYSPNWLFSGYLYEIIRNTNTLCECSNRTCH